VINWTGSRSLVMKTPSRDATLTLWKRRRDFDLPVIRAKAKYVFAQQIATSVQSGPPSAPEHEIDAGWWIQDEAQAQRTADYAGARVTVPQPVLSSVAIIPLPGLQLGDVVTLRDEHVTRLDVRGVVVGDSRSVSARDGGMDMSHAVMIRPTAVSRTGVTWEEWGAVMAGRQWQTWGGQQAGKTWRDWGAAPLAGEEI